MKNSTIIFYDGECGLCHASVKFLMERDVHDEFRFAPLQGKTAREKLGPDAATSSTVVLWMDASAPDADASADAGVKEGGVYRRSKAAIESLKKLDVAPWSQLGSVLSLFPRPLADLGYNTIAKMRTHLWPKPKGLCPLMPPDKAHKFLP